jgi:N-acetylneuraminic acid mutarotase
MGKVSMDFSSPGRSSRRSLLTLSLSIAMGVQTRSRVVALESTPTSSDLRWTSGEPLPSPGSEFQATVIDSTIYVAGGFGLESRMFSFDISAGVWTEHPQLPEPRHHAGLASSGGKVYLAGGHDHDNRAVDTFWQYDPDSGDWSDLPSLPQGPRGALGLAWLNGNIYAVGGSAGDLSGPATADLVCFDPENENWSELEPMPTAREHLAVAVAGGFLIAIGGRNGSDVDVSMAGATEVYDPIAGEWHMRSALPTPRSGMGVASSGNSVIVMGGEGVNGLYNDVNRYDPVADSWDTLPPLPSGRHGVAGAFADGLVFAIGGSTLAWQIQSIPDVANLVLQGE